MRILHEDIHILIADKGVNTIVHGSRDQTNTLLEQVRRYLQHSTDTEVPFLAPANRLDRNTCGPVVFAKDSDTMRSLRQLFSRCEVSKCYHARLFGVLTELLFIEADVIPGTHKRAKVDNMLCRRDNFPNKSEWFSQRTSLSGTISATLIHPISVEAGTTLAEIYPWTGRFHQIRAVCSNAGYPIYNDVKYNHLQRIPRAKKFRDTWRVPSLICKKLELAEFDISVESEYTLADIEQAQLHKMDWSH